LVPHNLDIDLLRTFAAIADSGGFARAAERVHRTQSAVSLQMRRLEAAAGVTLFERQGRSMVLSIAGERLLVYARRLLELNDEAAAAMAGAELRGRVRLGLAQDFADDALPGVLARFARACPGVALEVRVDSNARLASDADSGRYDLTLSLQRTGAGGVVLGQAPLAWIGGPAPSRRPGGALPLVLFEAPCDFRNAAIDSLTRAGLKWELVYTSPSLPGIRAAVRAGLGVTVRTPLTLEPDLRVLGPEQGLPALTRLEIALRRSPQANAAADALGVAVSEAVSTMLSGRPARSATAAR
jgi:DNA-binding transcriptional LysR family regulator